MNIFSSLKNMTSVNANLLLTFPSVAPLSPYPIHAPDQHHGPESADIQGWGHYHGMQIALLKRH